MTTFYTSDEHYGHANIIRLSNRPFLDVEHMNEEIVCRHNAVVKDGDEVWHLGDFSLDDRIVESTLARLNGTHRLVAGNHDACHPRHRKHEKMATRYVAWGFVTVDAEIVVQLPGVGSVRLHHMPYWNEDGHDLRYAEHRPKPKGERALLHGHVHGAWRRSLRPGCPLMINVGVDVWDYAPVSAERLAQEFAF